MATLSLAETTEHDASAPDSRPPIPLAARASLLATRVAPWALCLAPSLALLALGASLTLPFVADDALITLRYAERLAHGQGLTWTEGPRVEGITNLLFALLLAIPIQLGVEPLFALRFVSMASAVACLGLVIAAGRPRPGSSAAPLGAGLLLALSTPFVVWSVGGLEAPLVAALVTGACLGALALTRAEVPAPRSGAWLGAMLAAAWCTRPDAAIFGTVLLAVVASRWRSRAHWRALGVAIAVGLTLVLAVSLARRAYYGAWWPNTAGVKLAFNAARRASGLAYVKGGAIALQIPLLLTAGVLVFGGVRAEARRTATHLLLPAAAWLGWVLLIGGDIFPARRHWLPALSLTIAYLAVAGASLRDRAPWRSRGLAAALAILVPAHGWWQLRDPEAQRARDELWEWDGQALGALLQREFGARGARIAVDSAGSLPFFSELPAIDMLGLNERFPPSARPASFGKGEIGHELGDGTYVLAREPDLVLFNLPKGEPRPKFKAGRELLAKPEFTSAYRLLQLDVIEPRGRVRVQAYARTASSRLGAAIDDAHFDLPGFLFATGSAVAETDVDGSLGTWLHFEQPLVLELPRLGPGRWRLHVAASHVEAELVSGTARGASITVDVGAKSVPEVRVQVTRGALGQLKRVWGRRE